VDERRLADVRPADDRDDGQRGRLDELVTAVEAPLQDLDILGLELVVVETRAQARGALRRNALVEAAQPLRVDLVERRHRGVVELPIRLAHAEPLSLAPRTSATTASTVSSNDSSVESMTSTPGAAVRNSTIAES